MWHKFQRFASTSSTPKSFDEIPGPKALPFIGTLYKYLPYVGEYSFDKLHESGAKKLQAYGPLVKEEIVPRVPIVWVYKPEDIAQVFRAEAGRHPERRSHLALLKYRKDRSDIYKSGGLIPTNGPEWWRIRKEFQKPLGRPQNIHGYLDESDTTVKGFVQLCAEGQRFQNLLPLLARLFLELTCLVVFDTKFNVFSEEEMKPDSISSKLIDAAWAINSAVLKLDNGPQLWRVFDTPLYKKMCKAQAYMEKIAIDLISRKNRERLENNGSAKDSLLKTYLNNSLLDEKDIIGMTCDMLLAGVDTTTYTTAFTLYHLATNKEAQERLAEEARNLLPNPDDPITSEHLRNATYLRAVLKESFRLNPISVGIGRILQTDTILSGYLVPKRTVVVTQNQITCRLSEYFDQPNSFIPERWLRDKNKSPSFHPYLLLPFGHGPRSCIARRFAEQNMHIILLRICRKLEFSWKGKTLGSKSMLINIPDAPIDIEFQKRAS